MNKLINQTHLRLLEPEGYQLFDKVAKKCQLHYRTVVIKHQRGKYIKTKLRHVYIDEAIECFSRFKQHLAKNNEEQLIIFKQLKELIDKYDGTVPNTSDVWWEEYDKQYAGPSYNYSEERRQLRIKNKKLRRLAFRLKWREVYGI